MVPCDCRVWLASRELTMPEEQAAHQYILGADDSEHARLLAQCGIYRPEAERLFERLGIDSGQRVLEWTAVR